VNTEVLKVDPQDPEPERIARAAAVLRGGGLVAFPTETVYGLGANALDEAAVWRIFAAKGRPANNPVIVHIACREQVEDVTAAWPTAAERLTDRFWPGPLTLVLPRHPAVPDAVTAAGPTVALRMPVHPVALALLRAAALPVAAPSANRSTQLSPTRAEHVLGGLAGRIELVLDGGPAAGGLESTVLDLTTTPPRLLRPGLVTPAEIEGVIGPIERLAEVAGRTDETAPLPAPGMLPRHYAPRTPLTCVRGLQLGRALVEKLLGAGLKVGWLAFTEGGPGEEPLCAAGLTRVDMPPTPAAYAASLYATLHALDVLGLDRIVVALPPDQEEWLAIRDRLRRASAP
jgi:L-threonylcarbamoyladenylate synthase